MMGRIIRRELRLCARHAAELLNPLWFFLVVIVLFALGIGLSLSCLRASRRAWCGWRRCSLR